MTFSSKARSPQFCNPKARTRGFTLIEMVVVISMILILLAIALPMYNQSVIRAREATLPTSARKSAASRVALVASGS